MNLYKNIAFPFLKTIDPETAHHQTITALELAQNIPPGREVLRRIAGWVPIKPVVVAGLTFPNVLGIAAGFDKDVRVAAGLGMLGFGHIEVGTLTPRPQEGNPRPRIFRLPKDEALINRMGFPNGGVIDALPRLKKLAAQEKETIIGVSLGKQKETPLEDAAADYTHLMQLVYNYADYLAINISSPNTPGLRDLQGGQYLAHLLDTIIAESHTLAQQFGIEKRPLFLKIAPDLTEAELDEILDVVLSKEIDALIATNTTIGRDNCAIQTNGKPADSAAGRSPNPSTDLIRTIATKTDGQLPSSASAVCVQRPMSKKNSRPEPPSFNSTQVSSTKAPPSPETSSAIFPPNLPQTFNAN